MRKPRNGKRERANRKGEGLPPSRGVGVGTDRGGDGSGWRGGGDRWARGARGPDHGGGATPSGDARPAARLHGAVAGLEGSTGPGSGRRPDLRGHAPDCARSAAGVARVPRRSVAAALSRDEVLAMMQGPDIGKAIFEHTSDSRVVELPFGLGEWHLPTGWHLFGIDVSPTKHVVFMVVAAIPVFLTVPIAGRQSERRHREGKAPHGFGAVMEAIVLVFRNHLPNANIGHCVPKIA